MKSLLIVALAALSALSLNAADAAGTWKGSMDTQMGNTEVTITLETKADLTGNVKLGEYEGPVQKGKIEGDKISFNVSIGPGTVAFDGTVSGDEMRLNVIGTQGDKYNLVAKRQK